MRGSLRTTVWLVACILGLALGFLTGGYGVKPPPGRKVMTYYGDDVRLVAGMISFDCELKDLRVVTWVDGWVQTELTAKHVSVRSGRAYMTDVIVRKYKIVADTMGINCSLKVINVMHGKKGVADIVVGANGLGDFRFTDGFYMLLSEGYPKENYRGR